jgi:hypothetical protein
LQLANYLETNEMACKDAFEKVIFDFLEHVGSRRIDPCNVLVGRIPSHTVIGTLQRGEIPFGGQSSDCEEPEPILYDLLIRWSSIGIWSQVSKEMTEVLEKMKSKMNFQKGDLVVVRTETTQDTQQYYFPFHSIPF